MQRCTHAPEDTCACLNQTNSNERRPPASPLFLLPLPLTPSPTPPTNGGYRRDAPGTGKAAADEG